MHAHGAQISTGKEIVARVSLDTIDSRFPYALMIAQSETERVLEEKLAARGVKVERTVELTGFQDDGRRVSAKLRRADGTTETVTADWLAATTFTVGRAGRLHPAVLQLAPLYDPGRSRVVAS